MLDLNQKETIALDSTTAVIEKGDFLRTALKVLRRFGCIPTQGYDIEIQGNIPINAGLSSSTALTIAWIHFLIEAFGTATSNNSIVDCTAGIRNGSFGTGEFGRLNGSICYCSWGK